MRNIPKITSFLSQFESWKILCEGLLYLLFKVVLLNLQRPPEDQTSHQESAIPFFFPKNIIHSQNSQKDNLSQSRSSTASLLAELKLKNAGNLIGSSSYSQK